MKAIIIAAALVMASMSQMSPASASLATCGSGTTSLASGSTELFGNAFSSAQSFSDCYSFSIGTSSDAFGGTLTIDPLSFLDIDISSVTLSGAGLVTSLVDTTPGVFSFSDLVDGVYQLIVSGLVTKGKGFDDILPLPVGYAGSITTNAVTPTTPVPEPASIAMFGVALTGLALLRRRVSRRS